jgi:hypothetical protein
MKKLYEQQSQHLTHVNKQANNENRVINQIKDNLNKNKTMISKADNGKSIIVLYQEDYKEKINKFDECLSVHRRWYEESKTN